MTDALTLFDAPADLAREVKAPRRGKVRRGQPDTAHEAALSKALESKDRRAALQALCEAPSGLIAEQIHAAINDRAPHTAHTRCLELAPLGLVVLTDRKRATSTGRNARVWEVTPLGRIVGARLARGAA